MSKMMPSINSEAKSKISSKLGTYNLLRYSSLDSTNETAKKAAQEGAPEGTVIVAERQERGKGRLGRAWFSPPELGLWFSIIIRPQIKAAYASQLTFVSAVAVCKALRKAAGFPVMIKWPNDLLCGDKKVCGILTELNTERERINHLVIGIGVNINHQTRDFPPEIKDTAVSLAMVTKQLWTRAEILRCILQEFAKEYYNYLSQGFDQTLLQWRELNTTLGKEVIVSTKEGTFTGMAEDINETGCLLIRKATGAVVTLWAGDVSIRTKAF